MVAKELNIKGCSKVLNVLWIAYKFAPSNITGVASADTSNLISLKRLGQEKREEDDRLRAHRIERASN